MKNFRDYLFESEEAADNPVAGDNFAINIREECLIESVVVESRSDGVVIAADQHMMQLLESYGYTFEQTCMECGESGCGCGQAADDYSSDQPEPDPGEYDQEGDMAKNELYTMIRSARRLIGMLDNDDNMPEWTQKKITKATDYADTAADYISSQKERGVMEQSQETSPVARATLHRIMMRHPGMLAQHGPERVMQAVDDVADLVGDMDDIGSSDISGWVNMVQEILDSLDQGVAEGDYPDGSSIKTPGSEDWKQQYQQAVMAVKNAKTQQEYDTASDRAGRIKDLLASKGINVGPVLGQQGMAEGSRKAWMKHNNLVDLDPALKGLEDEMEKFIRLDPEERRKYQQGIKQRIKSDPMAGPKGVLPEQDMTEDLQADDGERYRSADDFFGQFEADHFDEERVSPDGMEVRGYIDGVNVMVWRFDNSRKTSGYGIYDDSGLNEAEYQGRKVPLGKPMRGDVAKSKVYVKDPKTGNVKKVNFGDPNMKIKKSNPARRKSFRARHNCDNPGPRTKARYWSCRAW
jgi:hypothetical protein